MLTSPTTPAPKNTEASDPQRSSLLDLRDLLRTARASDARRAVSEAVAHSLIHGHPDVSAGFVAGFLRTRVAKKGAR